MWTGRPTASASSSRLGLTTSGRAESAASSAGPEVSRAIRAPPECTWATTSAYHWGASPRGRLPQQASQCTSFPVSCPVFWASRTSASSAADSAALSSGPTALIFVRLPPSSAIETLIRVSPAIATASTSMP